MAEYIRGEYMLAVADAMRSEEFLSVAPPGGHDVILHVQKGHDSKGVLYAQVYDLGVWDGIDYEVQIKKGHEENEVHVKIRMRKYFETDQLRVCVVPYGLRPSIDSWQLKQIIYNVYNQSHSSIDEVRDFLNTLRRRQCPVGKFDWTLQQMQEQIHNLGMEVPKWLDEIAQEYYQQSLLERVV